jgi:hypothetical protein
VGEENREQRQPEDGNRPARESAPR